MLGVASCRDTVWQAGISCVEGTVAQRVMRLSRDSWQDVEIQTLTFDDLKQSSLTLRFLKYFENGPHPRLWACNCI